MQKAPPAPNAPVHEDHRGAGQPDVNPFHRGAIEHSRLAARWNSVQKVWTLLEAKIDERGDPDPFQSVLAGSESTRVFKETARLAVKRLRNSRDPEVRALAISLRDPWHVWLDLMRTKERGFRRIWQLTRWRGGTSVEEFLESGKVPSDARLTENGTIAQLFHVSADFWSDLLDVGFDAETGPVAEGQQRRAAAEVPKAVGRKTPSERLMEYKIRQNLRTQDRVAEALGLERSVYFDLKAGRRVGEETYVKAALAMGCFPDDLKP